MVREREREWGRARIIHTCTCICNHTQITIHLILPIILTPGCVYSGEPHDANNLLKWQSCLFRRLIKHWTWVDGGGAGTVYTLRVITQ